MFKKSLATAAAALIAGVAFASPALAVGNQEGHHVASGNGASQAYGNTQTGGYMSPQMGLVQGSLNKPCVGLPLKADVGSVVGIVPITVQDLLNSPQNQQCTENSTQIKGDDPLSHILSGIPVLSGNGAHNH